jgi:hypothetical protein
LVEDSQEGVVGGDSGGEVGWDLGQGNYHVHHVVMWVDEGGGGAGRRSGADEVWKKIPRVKYQT